MRQIALDSGPRTPEESSSSAQWNGSDFVDAVDRLETAEENESDRGPHHTEGGPLDAYLREIAPMPLLERSEEAVLARRMLDDKRSWLETLLSNPAVVAELHGRWTRIREAGRRTSTLAELSPERPAAETARNLDVCMERVGKLLRSWKKASSADVARRRRIEARMRDALLGADLNVRVLDSIQRTIAGDPETAARRVGLRRSEIQRRLRQGERAYERLLNAKGRLIQAHVKLVVYIAKRYRNMGVDFEDLIQEGNLGLIRAVEKFDPDRAVKCSSYADYWIRQSIHRALEARSQSIRLPGKLQEKARQVRRDEASIMAQSGREFSSEQWAQRMGLGAEEEGPVAQVLRTPASLDQPIAEDSRETLSQQLTDEGENSPLEELERRQLAQRFESLLGELKPRDREIVTRRFALDGAPPDTLETLGKKLGLSRERVRQLEAGALEQLGELARRDGLDHYCDG